MKVPSICRNCLAFCPILVTVEDGRAVKVEGDPGAGLYEGYTCPKGRALPQQHNDPERLLRCLARGESGSLQPIASSAMVDEIAARVQAIVERYGPRSVAAYIGTGVVSHPTGAVMAASWFRALGSPMIFSAATIDKPAANTSTALHGNWVAGAQGFASSDTWMIVGANPVISKSNGAPYYNPGRRLKDAVREGMKLIVIDPRRTETAKRAHIHLQPVPGEDAAILAGLVRVILEEGLHDGAFVARHSRGFESLRRAVAPFTPEIVAARAGLDPADIVAAARTFAGGKRGCVVCSTGASFSTRSNLTFYLALCLNTLCGRWGREGDVATYPNVMLPAFEPKAQAYPPYPVFGSNALRVRGLRENASGLPAAALADEILTEGPGQIRALFCLGGNPLAAWPDQERAEAALRKLDLLVVSECRMTATAERADFIVASPMTLEVPGATYFVEWLKYIGVSRGFDVPWAQYTPKIVDPPAGSDVMDERELFFRLGARMGLELQWIDRFGYGPHVEAPPVNEPLDMTSLPSVDELIALTCDRGRVPLSEVKRYPHGHLFAEARVPVAAADPGCADRLELGDAMMMAELAAMAANTDAPPARPDLPFRLVSRRENNFMNSVGQSMPGLNGGRPDNPVHLNPGDLASLGLSEDALVNLRSAGGAVVARVKGDASLRPGVVSLAQGFALRGADGGGAARMRASSSRLVTLDECDPITGIPRMSAIPVAIEPLP